MKILHTADWHLGKRLDSFSRHTEQIEVLNEICELAEQESVDAVIIAGDLYDTFNPPTESIELFYKTLKRLSNDGQRAVIAIAGNHDSPEKIEAPDPLARECGIIFAGFPNSVVSPFSLPTGLGVTKSEAGFIELNLPNVSFPLRLLLTPYANEYRLKTFLNAEDDGAELRDILAEKWKQLALKYCDTLGVNMMVAHLFMMQREGELPQEPEDEKPILHPGGAQVVYSENVPEQMQYAALGHLHKKQIIDTHPCPIVYSSSPLAYSFSESNQQKFVMLIEARPGKKVKHTAIPLNKGRKLLRAKFSDLDKALLWLSENPNDLVELTMISARYITAAERKRLTDAHAFIVNIIPEINITEAGATDEHEPIDLSKGIAELFLDFFKHRHGGQEPNERLINLFKEAINTEEEA